MGIHHLWTILTPFCERKPLYELQGKAVAIDLSCWICEAQNISEYQVQPRMYLRNLYFRTCYLLLMEVTPVFVLEGKAPELKYQTIADRNNIQFKGARPKTNKTKTGKDRSRFHFVLKQCSEMLQYMGLACVTGKGEAESMCAYLNADGMVAGCISQDSDCFAYGAKVVFRNFSISSQGNQTASGGAVDVYDIEKAKSVLKFGRNKIITLALLCGSDYNDGVNGIGKDTALKFINRYEDEEILDRIRSWRKETEEFKDMERKIADKKICTSCGHKGSVQSHSKSGCVECTTKKGCDFSRYREQRLEIKNELTVRTKALVDPDFPNEELINEYLIRKDNIKELNLRWRQPNLVSFVKFTHKFLGWEEIYAFEKFLPILTRWQVINFQYVNDCISAGRSLAIKGILHVDYIKKIRNPKGVPSYEIIWKDKDNYFNHLIPEEQTEKYKDMNKEIESLWSTIEPQNLVQKAYPELVEKFLESKTKKGKKVSKRKKEVNQITELNNALANTSISEPKPKKTRKKTVINKNDQRTIESFLNINKENTEINKIANNILKKTRVNLLKEQEHSKNLSVSFDLDASCFGDEDNINISEIIDEIVNQPPKLPEKVKKLGYYFEPLSQTNILNQDKHADNSQKNSDLTDSFSPIKKINNDDFEVLNSYSDFRKSNILKENNFSSPISKNVRRSSFFEISKEHDLFEKILNNKSSDEDERIYKKYELDQSSSLSEEDKNVYKKSNLNRSSFFEVKFNNEADLFEKSLNKNTYSDEDSSNEDTLFYDADQIDTNKNEDEIKKREETNEDSDNFSFEDNYVPLIDRIKKLKKT